MTGIFVESEFAPLRTVVLAQSELALSKAALNSPGLDFLPPDAPETVSAGTDFATVRPQRRWELERDEFAAVLRGYGVEVLRPRLLSDAEKAAGGQDGYANFFVRDPFFTIGDVVIEGSLRFRHRRREVLPVRDVLVERVYPAPCSYVAVPAPQTVADDEMLGAGPFLEGGDVLVLGKHVFVGMSGLASNDLGARWLRKLLEARGHTVEAVRVTPGLLHLDCALGLIRDGLMVVCEEALPDGIPAALKSWDRIPVSLSQAKELATNGLPINPDVYVTDPVFGWIGEQLEQRGVTVEYVEFGISRSLGGAFRCSTQPLLRRS